MSALDRAAHDEAHGDLAAARTRLASYLRTLAGHGGTLDPLPSQRPGAQAAYRPDIIERLARLNLRMGDPAGAGQWYFLIDSTDEHAADSIARFEASRGRSTFQLWMALPPWARNLPLEVYPPAARERIARIMPPHMKARAARASARVTATDWAVSIGCLAVVCAIIALIVVGAVSVVRWFRGV